MADTSDLGLCAIAKQLGLAPDNYQSWSLLTDAIAHRIDEIKEKIAPATKPEPNFISTTTFEGAEEFCFTDEGLRLAHENYENYSADYAHDFVAILLPQGAGLTSFTDCFEYHIKDEWLRVAGAVLHNNPDHFASEYNAMDAVLSGLMYNLQKYFYFQFWQFLRQTNPEHRTYEGFGLVWNDAMSINFDTEAVGQIKYAETVEVEIE